jgi:stearoyl-CoA desaturase (Delta-9 desaturase)
MPQHRAYNWINIAFLALSPVAALIGVGFFLYYQGFHSEELVVFVSMASCTALALTAGYHRYYSHRSYECHPAVQLFFLLFGAAALQNSALIWASNHRLHHRFVDQEGDPHNIKKGVFWAHMGWIFYKPHPGRNFANVPDLKADCLARWQHRYYLPLGIGVGFVLPLLIGFVLGRPWSGFLWGGLVRVVLLHHTTFLINSAGHCSGLQPYSAKDSSRDSWWLALLMFGDGYHNFHHAFPGDYRGGVAWYHWDPTKWWIWSLNRAGLAWRLNRTAARSIAQARVRMARLSRVSPEEESSRKKGKNDGSTVCGYP